VIAGALPVVEGAAAAGQDFMQGMKTHNDTLLFKAIGDLGVTCEALEPMLQTCDPFHNDVMGILDVLKQIHSPGDLVKHVEDDLRHDMDNIFEEAGRAFVAFRQQKYEDFGSHLGAFLHRLVIGKYPDGLTEERRLSEGLPPLPPIADILAFGIPFASAILSDEPHLLACAVSGIPVIDGVQKFTKDFKNALANHSMPALSQSVKDIAGACASAKEIKPACSPIGDDVKEIVRVMKTIDNVAGLIDHIIYNLRTNVDNIEDNMDKAFKAFRKDPRDLTGFGDNLGKALHRLIIEKYPDDVVLV
jgi:hypothetical protein